ncbi:MAG: hypothetical protein R3C20_24210 [Planctomycetaceae bacterium]
MNEIRTDVLTGRRVIVAQGRESRPNAHSRDPELDRSVDPFAEGSESETPSERLAWRDISSSPNQPGWKLRVVPNRYPAVTDSTALPSPGLTSNQSHTVSDMQALFPVEHAIGEHDVVIECPDLRTRLIDLTPEEVALVLQAWSRRIGQLRVMNKYTGIAAFRNEGFSAGGSLAHAHSQIAATADLMPLQAARVHQAEAFLNRTGRELVEELMQAELASGMRIVHEDHEWIWMCPFASRTSWHVRVIPRINQSMISGCFDKLSDHQLERLAQQLRALMIAMHHELGSFSHNLALVHAPLTSAGSFRWMLEVLPRRGRIAGWELLTDVDIVTTAPETAAAKLRGCIPRDDASGMTPSSDEVDRRYGWV